MNFRVADVQACYKRWKKPGSRVHHGPLPRYGEIRCYICDADGHIIEVGQAAISRTVNAWPRI